MGYCISQIGTNFEILSENKQKALNALKDYFKNNNNKDDILHYHPWVDEDKLFLSNTLEDALYECRWEVDIDDNGDISYISFIGEKYGDDEQYLNSIAPFVEKDSYIEFSGEDGELFRWIFDGETCKEIYPRIDWK